MLGVLRHQCSNYMIRQCYITIQKICYIYQLLNHPRKHERLDNKGVENQQEMNRVVYACLIVKALRINRK